MILQAKNISKQFKAFSLEGISLELSEGEITGVVGENGNGKTTLLRILAGELSCTKGQLVYPFANSTDWHTIKQSISYIPQRIPKWYGLLKENLYLSNTVNGLLGDANVAKVDELLTDLGLEEYKDHSWDEISTGYRLRFQLAKIMLSNPKLIILDEPLANLDINAEQKFLGDLIQLASKYKVGVILTSQQLHEIEQVADNIIFLKRGKALYSGKRTTFAEERKENIFEISGEFNLPDLQTKIVADKIFEIKDKGTCVHIITDVSFSAKDMLAVFIEKDIEVEYFRNISNSTRKLFV